MQRNQVTVFDFSGHNLNCVLDEAGNPLFRADDVCEILEFENPYTAVSNHVDGDDLLKAEVIDSLGRTQLANHVNESGLYSLIFGQNAISMLTDVAENHTRALDNLHAAVVQALGRRYPII